MAGNAHRAGTVSIHFAWGDDGFCFSRRSLRLKVNCAEVNAACGREAPLRDGERKLTGGRGQ